jgi:galactonate dehydratase
VRRPHRSPQNRRHGRLVRTTHRAHTAGGPLLFYASTHLSTASPNVWIQESCQRFYEHDWPAMLENPIAPKNGFISMPEDSGFGMRIKPEAWNHPAAVRQISGRG